MQLTCDPRTRGKDMITPEQIQQLYLWPAHARERHRAP